MVCFGDNLHEMSSLIFGEKEKNIVYLSFAEFSLSIVKLIASLGHGDNSYEISALVSRKNNNNKKKKKKKKL